MAKRRKSRAAKAPTIIITISEQKFKSIFGTQAKKCTEYDSITIKHKDGGHDLGRDSKGDKVLIKASTTLRFRIECSDVTPNPYYPIGIAFAAPPPTPPIPPPSDPERDYIERLGLDLYDPINRIADADKPKRHLLVVGCTAYVGGSDHAFHIFIQDGRTGDIGIIDPRIVHEPIVIVPKNSRGRKTSNKNTPSSG